MQKSPNKSSNTQEVSPVKTGAENAGEFRIDYNGQWFHDGQPINRKALAKLFSDRALVCDEDGCYWLRTPYEQYLVHVEDVPFVITSYREDLGEIDLITNMDDVVPLGLQHRLLLRAEPKRGEIVPYVVVRDELRARLSRSVFIDLANMALDQGKTSIRSRGVDHPLGSDV